MIVLNKSNNADVMRLTLSEDQSLNTTTYKAVFTSRQTKQEITVEDLEDTSLYPSRYNKLTIDTATEFEDMPGGFWDYKIYATDGVDEELVERGTMKLLGDDLEVISHIPDTNTHKVYNGD